MRNKKENNRVAGFSMIEVLVALLVLSIGLLGLAALQTSAIKFVHQSYQRTQAMFLIYEIVDKMRANKKGLDHYIFSPGSSTSVSSKDCSVYRCNAAEVAAYDLNKWKESIKIALGSETGEITRNGLLYTIKIMWRERDANQEQSVNVQLEA